MGKYLVIIGLLMNSAVMIINRVFKKIPDGIYIPVIAVGIILMIAGAILTK